MEVRACSADPADAYEEKAGTLVAALPTPKVSKGRIRVSSSAAHRERS
ncbi:hypothetical protein AB0K64_17190 [Streptomyces sp. NPDC053741]|uniref:Uncharacterized protein n=1 Tax=Streptomyces pratensis (strain ATCC 33331 / IAF-45CD) TaxID=591167 RepID=A0A8D3WI19_STRFA|nr:MULTISPECIES: hypothetical protein [unclassified Streptomyces]WKV77504.1 hypothetical protein HBB06_04830 [Streptomyces sp. SNU607]